MAKTQANYPTSKDSLTVDRVAGQDVTSDTMDVVEGAITEMQAEMRRVTTKTTTATLTSNEGGLVIVTSASAWTCGLPAVSADIAGLTFFIVKTDDTTNVVTLDGNDAETINGAATYVGLNRQWAWVAVRCITTAWVIIASSELNIITDTSPELGGELDCGAHSVGFTLQTLTGDGTDEIDWKVGNYMKFTCGAHAEETFTFVAPTNPCTLTLQIKQDATGGRDITFPVTVKWLGTEPTWTDGGANKTIIMCMKYDGTNYWAQGTPWEE